MAKTLIFTTNYNQIENIEKLTQEIIIYCNAIEIIVVDDNIPDRAKILFQKLEN